MKRLLKSICALTLVGGGLLTLSASSANASSSWSSWGARCAKWIADIPKVDANIIRYNTAGNTNAMAFQMIALSADGQKIRACNTSPDARLNSALRSWGSALIPAGIDGYNWAQHGGNSRLTQFLAAESVAKHYETVVQNRLIALGL
jgi:hypothetical protein